MKNGIFLKILLFVCCLHSYRGLAQNVLVLSDKSENYPVAGYLTYMEDKNNSFILADVIKLDDENKFLKVGDKGLSLGYTTSTFWFKLTLIAEEEHPRDWLIQFSYPLLTNVTLFSPDGAPKTRYEEISSGYLKSYKERDLPSKYTFMPLKGLSSSPKTFYFKVSSQNSFIVNAEIKSLKSLLHNESQERIYFYLIIGILIAMLVYNSFIALSTRTGAYKIYVIYIFSLIVFQLGAGGFLPELFSNTSVETVQRIMQMSMGFILIFSCIFATLFLRLRVNAPKIHKIIVVLTVLSVLWFLAGTVVPFSKIIPIGATLMIITASVLIASAVVRTVQRYRPAYFYLFSWVFILTGGSLYALRTVGLVADTFLSKYSIQIGGVCESLLIAFALADRMNMDRNEREHAEKMVQEERLEIERLQKVELQNKLMAKDIAATHAVQETLLPPIGAIPQFNFASFYKPAEQTGGDWFSYFWEREHNRIYVFIGDVTGHGIPSALVTGVACGAIRSSISTLHRGKEKENIPLLEDSLTTLAYSANSAILDTGSRSGRFMTMVLVGIDTLTGEAAVANAGHNMPFLISPQREKVTQINNIGFRLGYSSAPTFSIKKFKMNAGDILFLYTDGLIENQSESGEMISPRALKHHLGGQADIEVIKDNVLQLCSSTWKGQPFADDVTFLLVKWEGQV